MPYRFHPPVTDQYYHVYNRGLDGKIIYDCSQDYARFLDLLNYYSYVNPPFRFSRYQALTTKNREKYLLDLKKNGVKLVELYCFCLMNNHFHLLLKQLIDNGLMNFMRIVQNAYAKYYNTKNKRKGRLIQSEYQYKLMKSDEQFDNTSRYIHLNPVKSNIITLDKLESYSYSSYPDYVGKIKRHDFIDISFIKDRFASTTAYAKFIAE